jgi:hypothetical protein
MRKDVFVYISGPITGKNGYLVEENVAAGLKMFLDLINLGVPAYAPQMTAAFPSAFNIPWETWMELDYAVIAGRCTHMIMLPRWRESRGAIEERNFAEAHNIRVCESLPELLDAINEA